MARLLSPMWSIHIALIGFGLSGLFGKWLPHSPMLITAGRAGFGALTLWLILKWRKEPGRLTRNQAGWLTLTGVVLAVHWVTFFQSIQVSSVAIGVMAFSSSPVFTILMEPVVFRERFRPELLVPVGVVIVGLALIATSGEALGWESQTVQGVLWGLASGFLHALLGILNRMQVRSHSAVRVGLVQDGVAALVLLPFAWSEFGVLTPQDWALLAVLGIFFTAGAHGLLIHALKTVQAQVANLIVAGLEPVYGILFALIFLGEIPTLQALLGGLLIIGSTLQVTFRSSSP